MSVFDLVDDLEGMHPETLARLAKALGKARKFDERAALLVAVPGTLDLGAEHREVDPRDRQPPLFSYSRRRRPSRAAFSRVEGCSNAFDAQKIDGGVSG